MFKQAAQDESCYRNTSEHKGNVVDPIRSKRVSSLSQFCCFLNSKKCFKVSIVNVREKPSRITNAFHVVHAMYTTRVVCSNIVLNNWSFVIVT